MKAVDSLRFFILQRSDAELESGSFPPLEKNLKFRNITLYVLNGINENK